MLALVRAGLAKRIELLIYNNLTLLHKIDILNLSLKSDLNMSTLQTFPIHTPAQLSVHLKSLRKARGLTQAALGQRIGLKQVRVASIEKNPGAVSIDQLLQVFHALDARLLLADTKAWASAPPATALIAQSPAADW